MAWVEGKRGEGVGEGQGKQRGGEGEKEVGGEGIVLGVLGVLPSDL